MAVLVMSMLLASLPPSASAQTTDTGKVAGTVTSSEGGPAAEVCVVVLVEGEPAGAAFSKDDGTYLLDPVPADTVEVQALDCVNTPQVWEPSPVRQVPVSAGQTTSGIDLVVTPTGEAGSGPPPVGEDPPDDPDPDPDPDPGPDPTDPDDEPPSFTDSSDSVFSDDIVWMASAGITRGCNPPDNTRFCPDERVTRGQMAAFLNRALGLPDGSASFSDTTGHTFSADISALAGVGITRGCNPPDNTRFCPDDPVTRGQMAAFLNRALGLSGGAAAFSDTTGHTFDADISALATAGITRGCNPPDNNRFCPDDPVTRGQMAAFLHRALPESLVTTGVESPPPPPALDLESVYWVPPVANPFHAPSFYSTVQCEYNSTFRHFTLFSSYPKMVYVPSLTNGWLNDFGFVAISHKLWRLENGKWAVKWVTPWQMSWAADTGGYSAGWKKLVSSGWQFAGYGTPGYSWDSLTTQPGYYAVSHHHSFWVNGRGWSQFGLNGSYYAGVSGNAIVSPRSCYNPG